MALVNLTNVPIVLRASDGSETELPPAANRPDWFARIKLSPDKRVPGVPVPVASDVKWDVDALLADFPDPAPGTWYVADPAWGYIIDRDDILMPFSAIFDAQRGVLIVDRLVRPW